MHAVPQGALMGSFRRDPRRAVGVVVVDGGGEEEMVVVGEEEGDERAKGTGQGVTGTRIKTQQLRFYILHFGSETDINIPGCQTAKLPLMVMLASLSLIRKRR